MTFDPFGDFKELGYLRNIAGFKDLAMVKALEHGSFQRNLDRAITELADAKFIEYKQILNIHKTLFGDNVICKDSGLESLSAIEHGYTFEAILLNIL